MEPTKKPVKAKKKTAPAKATKPAKAVPKKKPAAKKPAKETKPAKKINCQLPGAELLKQGKSVKEVMDALEKEKKSGLKGAQERFCIEYIIDDNATRAYQRAYPHCSYDTANANGARLLANASVRSRVEQLRDERNKRLAINGDKVLRRCEARASVTPRDFYDAEGNFIPVHELHPDVAIGIKSIEVAELFQGSGEEKTAIGLVRKITMVDGKASDELLGKNLKLWKEVGSDDNPIKIVGKIELVPLT